MPIIDEPHATNVVGVWSCAATDAQGSKHYLEWELGTDGERIAGRFSQHSEYRVAFISGGIFRSNQFELNADYINDHYTLKGTLRDGRLLGTWRHLANEEHGTWEATRIESKVVILPATEAVRLFEWRRGDERRYLIEAQFG